MPKRPAPLRGRLGRPTRRTFLAQTGLAGASLLLLRNPRSAFSYEANEKLGVALVGVGGRGTWFVDTVPRMERVVAVCDVDDRKVAEAFQRWAKAAARLENSQQESERSAAPAFRRLGEQPPPAFRDFREMLERRGAEIDAVIIATPDHTHAVACAAALHRGKHVLCEKPLTRTVAESSELRRLARSKKGVVTMMGNQGTASGAYRRALELIQDGALGEIQEVHVWNNGGGADRTEPPGTMPVPDYLAWDLWLGPARERAFHEDWLRRNNWRDFGTCQLGNWASHSANLAFRALQVQDLWLQPPPEPKDRLVRVEAACSGLNRLSFPRWETVQWSLPARGTLSPIRIQWSNGAAPGVRDHLEDLIQDGLDWGDKKEKRHADHAGTIIVGSKGTLHANGHNTFFRLLPAARFEGVSCDHPERLPASRGHEADFFAACRDGSVPWASFDYATALNEFLMLGNVATQVKGAFSYDPTERAVPDHTEAASLLESPYRKGWTL